MTAGEGHPLFGAAVVELSVARSGGRLSVEARDGGGAPLATADDDGTVSDTSGQPVLRVPLGFDGPRDKGTSVKADVTDPAGTRLGEVKVTSYSYGPRAKKATLSIRDASGELARLEPQDRKGEEVAIEAGGRGVGKLQQTGRKRGLFRGSSAWRLELTGPLEGLQRQLVVAAAIRYEKLAQAAANAAASERSS